MSDLKLLNSALVCMALSFPLVAMCGYQSLTYTPRDAPSVDYYGGLYLDPEVRMNTFERALDAWREVGFPILAVDAKGTLRVYVDPSLLDTGSTEGRRVDGFANVQDGDCTVWVRNADDPMTLAHEIGHCIGFQHPLYGAKGTIMHPTDRGWDFSGLR